MPVVKKSEMDTNAPGVRSYRWGADTCGCVLLEFHDPKNDLWSGHLPENQGGYRKCTAHANVPNDELYQVLHTENINKNLAHGKATEHGGVHTLTEQEKHLLGLLHRLHNPGHHLPIEIPDTVPHPAKGVSYEFSDPTPGSHVRVLKLKLHGYTKEEKSLSRTKIHEVVDPKHVVIE